MEITQELVKELFEYKDGGLYRKKSAPNSSKGSRFGSVDYSKGYRRGRVNYKHITEHRLIYLYFYGELPETIDHINGDRLDNRIENLRKATASQNQHNRKNQKNSTSGHKGVCFDSSRNKWVVQVAINNKRKKIGRFEDFELACLVADEARNLYHGEYARHG